MFDRRSIGVITLSAALCLSTDCAQAFDDAKYPNWKGQWSRVTVPGLGGQPAFDPTKPWGSGQQAPLTAEYQKVLEDSMADQAKGGLGNYPTASFANRLNPSEKRISTSKSGPSARHTLNPFPKTFSNGFARIVPFAGS
jgi:hypothetical protein